MPAYRRAGGAPIGLGPELGAGGEATVYALVDDSALVAKVYARPTAARSAKLRAMLANPPRDTLTEAAYIAVAWPVDLVYDATDIPAGFLMPRVNFQTNLPLLTLYHPQDRRARAPNFTWEYLLHTAANLARLVGSLHAQGYVVGDLNESNCLVANNARVTLVDCDSLQVPDPDGPGVFRCLVGKPEYTPPELQGIDLGSADRTSAQDAFGLAVLVFLLLMEGTHPFAGVWRGAGPPPDIVANIAAGRCPYLGGPALGPPPGAPLFDTLPPPVQALLRRCFGPGLRNPTQRPTAAEWQTGLGLARARLATCPANRQHRYSAHLGDACPWCARMRRLRLPDPFPPPGQARPAVRRPAPRRAPIPPRPARPGAPFYMTPAPAPPVPAPRLPARWTGIAGTIFPGVLFALCVLVNLPRIIQTASRPPGPPALPAALSTPTYLPTPPVRGVRDPAATPPLRAAAETPQTAVQIREAPALSTDLVSHLTGRLAFTALNAANEDLAVLAFPGDTPQRLTSSPLAETDPAWAPDGRRLAFSSDRDGNWEIYTLAADGRDEMRLTSDPALDEQPAWSPDGTRIAFASRRGGPEAIYLVAAGGGRPIPLLSNGTPVLCTSGSPLAWAPDGTRIAFTTPDGHIGVVPILGGAVSYVAAPPAAPAQAATFSDPAWAPKDDRLAFVLRFRPRPTMVLSYRLCVVAAGAPAICFPVGADWDVLRHPTWSPDGRYLAVESAGDLYTVAADGTAQEILLGDLFTTTPAWTVP